jgi:hypothetical protein
MSKITFALFFILLIFVGILVYVVYWVKPTAILTTFTKPVITPSNPITASLSFSTTEQNIQRGQTVTVAVLLHNPNPHPSVVQLEIGYNPADVTINSLMPGTFFTNPTVALQNIDPVTGRISYALHCPIDPLTNNIADCVNPASSTVALINLLINPYAIKDTMTLSFLPKTVIRTSNGKDILQNTTPLQLKLNQQLLPVSSGSAIIQPQSNFIRVTPVH